MEFGRFFEDINNRKVALDVVEGNEISTVFLGLDHSYADVGEPVLWETLVLSGPMSDNMDRCSGTRSDAMDMHNRMVAQASMDRAIKID